MPNPSPRPFFPCSSSICVAMVEGGPKRAAMLATGRMPDGAPIVGLGGNWKCVQESCGNINFPSRTVCNKCKAPKPTQADLAAKGIAVAGVLTPRVGGVGGVSPHLASAVANPAGGYYPPVPPLGGVPPNVMLPRLAGYCSMPGFSGYGEGMPGFSGYGEASVAPVARYPFDFTPAHYNAMALAQLPPQQRAAAAASAGRSSSDMTSMASLSQAVALLQHSGGGDGESSPALAQSRDALVPVQPRAADSAADAEPEEGKVPQAASPPAVPAVALEGGGDGVSEARSASSRPGKGEASLAAEVAALRAQVTDLLARHTRLAGTVGRLQGVLERLAEGGAAKAPGPSVGGSSILGKRSAEEEAAAVPPPAQRPA
ncbi:hypothetical protein EMIHUDRAFT_231714 [Emiliania huxleyi CCMP1516]|uniref:RanBP2-type domain-containing protein n=2 Tax=Emiliania huxleyi TaxID=2903 RepID=A0A0D3K711_EMIH1|nr:hypothetical protein EMIHUDRAFT_231714 [Emiliania huxleyi CCMP1516]EOD31546.1 hypothetical protein EMIHUDRAFT_231714 [Emiliania huxleyi CCMP1516]|eukprot:XP_005783975.1 hypothetical protein EMIHUDRAFT_231714 [Emiliania huxleyi CCMP1516]